MRYTLYCTKSDPELFLHLPASYCWQIRELINLVFSDLGKYKKNVNELGAFPQTYFSNTIPSNPFFII